MPGKVLHVHSAHAPAAAPQPETFIACTSSTGAARLEEDGGGVAVEQAEVAERDGRVLRAARGVERVRTESDPLKP